VATYEGSGVGTEGNGSSSIVAVDVVDDMDRVVRDAPPRRGGQMSTVGNIQKRG